MKITQAGSARFFVNLLPLETRLTQILEKKQKDQIFFMRNYQLTEGAFGIEAEEKHEVEGKKRAKGILTFHMFETFMKSFYWLVVLPRFMKDAVRVQ